MDGRWDELDQANRKRLGLKWNTTTRREMSDGYLLGMTNGYLIPTDGNITKHQQPKMSEIGAVIGSQTGLFDLVYGEIDGKIFLIWVDDTGLIDGRPINPLASMIAGRPLFGDVFVSGDENEEGVVQDLEFEAFDAWFSNRLLMALTSDE